MVSTRGAGLRLSDPFAWAWEVLVLLAGAALVWDGLYMATFSPGPSPIIPVFDWLFTFAPALLAGLLFLRRDRSARRAAALCTGVVTVPLLALARALLNGPGLSLAGVGATLWDTAFFGVLPLTVAVAFAGSIGKPEMPGL